MIGRVISGDGGAGGSAGNGGVGGDGITANATQIVNTGTIIGGNGGLAGNRALGGQAGSLDAYDNTYTPGTAGTDGLAGIAGAGGVGIRSTGNSTVYNASISLGFAFTLAIRCLFGTAGFLLVLG